MDVLIRMKVRCIKKEKFRRWKVKLLRERGVIGDNVIYGMVGVGVG